MPRRAAVIAADNIHNTYLNRAFAVLIICVVFVLTRIYIIFVALEWHTLSVEPDYSL